MTKDFGDIAYCFNCKHFDYKTKICKFRNGEVGFGSTCINFIQATDMNIEEFQKEHNLKSRIKEVSGDIEKVSENILTEFAQKKVATGTEMITDLIKTKECIYTVRNDDKTEMWIYRKGIYVPQGKSYIHEYVRQILKSAYTTYICNQVISKIEADTFIDSKNFFSNNIIDEVPVQNGLLNIYTKELNDFDPDKIFFGKLPVCYDSKKKCPNIIKHFETVLKNKEDAKVMQELFGFLLLKEYKIEKAVMFNGSGRNGKSKTQELMKRFIGSENCSSVSLQLLEDDMFSISELFGKMANICGDISSSALKNTGRFKELTGRDLVTAPRKFLPPIYFQNFAKLIFSCNQLPISYDITEAFWERWVYLDFPYTFKTKKEISEIPKEERENLKEIDPEIIEKLTTKDEMSGLLNWALEGLYILLKQKDFSFSKTASDVKSIWIRKADNFEAFIMDCIEDDYDRKITKKDLKRAYTDYCKKYKLNPCSEKHVKNSLNKMGVGDDRFRSGDIDEYYWYGIKFKFDQGVQDDYGFSPYTKNLIFAIGQDTIVKRDKLVKNSSIGNKHKVNDYGVQDNINKIEKVKEEFIEDTFKNNKKIIKKIIFKLITSKNIIKTNIILVKCKGIPEKDVLDVLEKLRKQGDLFNPKPDYWKRL